MVGGREGGECEGSSFVRDITTSNKNIFYMSYVVAECQCPLLT